MVWLATFAYEKITTPGEVFDRFNSGDCYVTVWANGSPATWVTKVLGKTPSGAYILYDAIPRPDSKKVESYTLSEADFRDDEQKFHLRFKKIACP